MISIAKSLCAYTAAAVLAEGTTPLEGSADLELPDQANRRGIFPSERWFSVIKIFRQKNFSDKNVFETHLGDFLKNRPVARPMSSRVKLMELSAI